MADRGFGPRQHYSPSVVLGSIELRLRNIALGPPNTVAAVDWNQAVQAALATQAADSTGHGDNGAHVVATDANGEMAAKESRQKAAQVQSAASATSPSTRNAATQRQQQQQKARVEPRPPQLPQPVPPQEQKQQQLVPPTSSTAAWQQDGHDSGHRSPHPRPNRAVAQIAPVAGATFMPSAFSVVLLLVGQPYLRTRCISASVFCMTIVDLLCAFVPLLLPHCSGLGSTMAVVKHYTVRGNHWHGFRQRELDKASLEAKLSWGLSNITPTSSK